MNAERVRNTGGERLHNARRVEDNGDCDGEHEELDEPDDLASEQEKDGNDSDNPKEQRSEQALKVRHKTGSAERKGGCRGKQVRRHLFSGGLGAW
ncbi:MAG: hypothetical protein ACLQI7_22605, partial [Streptosporangiaceae bacterium]